MVFPFPSVSSIVPLCCTMNSSVLVLFMDAARMAILLSLSRNEKLGLCRENRSAISVCPQLAAMWSCV